MLCQSDISYLMSSSVVPAFVYLFLYSRIQQYRIVFIQSLCMMRFCCSSSVAIWRFMRLFVRTARTPHRGHHQNGEPGVGLCPNLEKYTHSVYSTYTVYTIYSLYVIYCI